MLLAATWPMPTSSTMWARPVFVISPTPPPQDILALAIPLLMLAVWPSPFPQPHIQLKTCISQTHQLHVWALQTRRDCKIQTSVNNSRDPTSTKLFLARLTGPLVSAYNKHRVNENKPSLTMNSCSNVQISSYMSHIECIKLLVLMRFISTDDTDTEAAQPAWTDLSSDSWNEIEEV